MRARSIAFLAAIAVGSAGCMRLGARECCVECPAPAVVPALDPDGARLPAAVTGVADPRAWRVIAIHHSASAVGGAARFDVWHKAKGWDGVGYDFVIGNGTDTADGAIETTFRWTEQRDGAHVKGWNDLAIGICLVGNFEETDPTPAQMASLETLVRYLRRRFAVPRQRVVGHGQLGDTQCPGKRLSPKAIAAATDPDGAEAPPTPPNSVGAKKPPP